MFLNKLLFYLISLILFLTSLPLYSQSDLYTFPSIEEETKVKEIKEAKPSDPFLILLSKKFGTSQRWLDKNFSRGVGRTELIRLILISKKSGKSVEEIMKDYEKGTSIKKIALSHKIDYSHLRKETSLILKETEEELKELKKKSKVAPPTAGVSERTTKEELPK